RAAPGRRPRPLPRRRPAREDRSRVDGALARGARSLLRHRRLEPGARAPRPAEGARAREEGAAPARGRAAPAAEDRPRAQARLLDPRERLAARRAGAVRARRPLARDRRAPGLLPAGRGRTCPRRPRLGPRGPKPTALGPPRLHALAPEPRRAHAPTS